MISEYQLSQIYLGDKFCHFLGQVPPNQDFLVQPHLPLWEGPNAIYCHVSRRCLQRGKVMGVRYPDQVGKHKPCEPEFGYVHMSPFGTVLFCHDGGRWCLW